MNRRGFFGTVAGAFAAAVAPRGVSKASAPWVIEDPTVKFPDLIYETLRVEGDPYGAQWELSSDSKTLCRLDGPLPITQRAMLFYDCPNGPDSWIVGYEDRFYGNHFVSVFRLTKPLARHYGYVVVEDLC